MEVELNDGRTFTGTVYGIDTLTDLAIVKIDGDGPADRAPLGDSDALKVGQLVIAIGSPLGTYSNSVTSGIVSAKGRSITTETATEPQQPDPDRRGHQPGQLGRPAARRQRQRGRHQHGHRRATATASASPSRSTSPARSWSRRSPASSWPGRTWASTYTTITRQLAEAENLPVNDGALDRRQRRRCRPSSPDTPGRGRRPPGRRHHRQGQRHGHRRDASARCDAQPVRAGRHDRRRDPARRHVDDDLLDPGDPAGQLTANAAGRAAFSAANDAGSISTAA